MLASVGALLLIANFLVTASLSGWEAIKYFGVPHGWIPIVTMLTILVLGVAPILAPSLGSALLNVTSWRGIFVALALAAVALWLVAWRALPETLPPASRQPASPRSSIRAYGRPAGLGPSATVTRSESS